MGLSQRARYSSATPRARAAEPVRGKHGMQDAWMEAYLRLRSCVCQCPVVRACSVCHVFCEISFILYEMLNKEFVATLCRHRSSPCTCGSRWARSSSSRCARPSTTPSASTTSSAGATRTGSATAPSSRRRSATRKETSPNQASRAFLFLPDFAKFLVILGYRFYKKDSFKFKEERAPTSSL